MKLTVIAGIDKEFKLKSNKKDGLYLERSTGFLQTEKIMITGNLSSLEQITEENRNSILTKAGWGTVGGLLLGPIGLAAGLWLTGKSKEICIACELQRGEKFVANVDSEAYKELIALTYIK